MRTIVAGSRTIVDQKLINSTLDNLDFEISCVISGGARGVDHLGEMYARSRGIDFVIFFACWEKYGRRAGYLRNLRMAQHADALIAFWDGHSVGTENMIDLAHQNGLIVRVV